jgi:hypothetical protein
VGSLVLQRFPESMSGRQSVRPPPPLRPRDETLDIPVRRDVARGQKLDHAVLIANAIRAEERLGRRYEPSLVRSRGNINANLR